MTLYAKLHICSLILRSCHVKGDMSNEWHPYTSICSIMYSPCIFLEWLYGRNESWKYYDIYLLWQCPGSCGFGSHVVSVYALYLSLINAVLMSAVIHTSEQRWGLTQRAFGFLPTFKAQKGRDPLPLACVSELEQEDRCSRKIHTKTKGCQSGIPLLLECTSRLEALSLFPTCTTEQKEVQSCVFQQNDCCTHFPQMKACDSDAEQSRGSARGLSDLLLCGSSISPISAIGLLFSDDLFTDKWRVTNCIIMLLVFS